MRARHRPRPAEKETEQEVSSDPEERLFLLSEKQLLHVLTQVQARGPEGKRVGFAAGQSNELPAFPFQPTAILSAAAWSRIVEILEEVGTAKLALQRHRSRR